MKSILFDIKKSTKLSCDESYIVTLADHIIMRVVVDNNGKYELMTPTASENDNGHFPYPNIPLLKDAFYASLQKEDNSFDLTEEQDCKGRTYFKANIVCDYISDVYRLSESLLLFLDKMENK
ncbi:MULTISPECIES: hypothetical protein [Aliivibrio]|uniref:hypothetical protein n=1 Tax=Aliivibrio TaxID=511678 RepID=UPI00037E2C2A|nr:MULTISPECIES: hypothetical protein [Aliivibrio]OEE17315.1 hypothetical protein A1Q3_16860 [Aliivibrio fischeri ZF-211]